MTADLNSMAYVGPTPWHGLGGVLERGRGIDEWAVAAGMNWKVLRTRVRFATGTDAADRPILQIWDDKHVFIRSDTKVALGIGSSRFQVVQPRDTLEFFRDLLPKGYEMETAGCLRGGARFWALARSPRAATIVKGDQLKSYLLLATAVDGSMKTTAAHTMIRVVCQNTLRAAVGATRGNDAVKVSHATEFDAVDVKEKMGVIESQTDQFFAEMEALSRLKITTVTAARVAVALFPKANAKSSEDQGAAAKEVLSLFDGRAIGASLAGQTGWGLLNAVTEYVDHRAKAASTDNRLQSAWFGKGANVKAAAADTIRRLAA